MNTPKIENLCYEMLHLKINADPKVKVNIDTSKSERVRLDDLDDNSPSYLVTPYYDSILIDNVSHTSPIYQLEKQNPFPWEVSLAFAPGYMRFEPNLLEVKSIDTSKC